MPLEAKGARRLLFARIVYGAAVGTTMRVQLRFLSSFSACMRWHSALCTDQN